MSNQSRSRSEEEEEDGEEAIKIAVFSVHKKGSILKRIFLNCPPPPDRGEGGRGGEDDGRPILFGRHPDCHVVLDHPSISRYHLAVRLVPSRQKLSVTDLSSVHGTWVSGIRIPPNLAVDMADGETLRLGASTRVYMLQWVSSSRVLEMENPLESVLEDKDDSGGFAPDANELWPTAIPSAPPLPESLSTSPLSPEREPQIPVGKAPEVDGPSSISAAYPMPTVVADSSPQIPSVIKRPAEQEYLNPESAEKRSSPSIALPMRNSPQELANSSLLPPELQSPVMKAQEVESSSSVSPAPMEESIESSMTTVMESNPRVLLSAVREPSQQESLSPERSEKRNAPSSLLSRRSKSKSIGFLRIDTGRDNERIANPRPVTEIEPGVDQENKTACEVNREEKLCRVLLESFEDVCGKEQIREECFESDKENVTPLSSRQKIRSSRVLQKSVCVAEHSTVEVSVLRPAIEESKNPTFKRLVTSSMADGNYGSDQDFFNLSASAAKYCQKATQQLHYSNFEVSSVLEEDVVHVDKVNWISDSCRAMESRESRIGTTENVEDNAADTSVLEDVLRINDENWIPDSCKGVKLREMISGIVTRFEDNVAAPSVSEAMLHNDKENFRLTRAVDSVVAASSVLENVLHLDKENQTPESFKDVKSSKLKNGALAKVDNEDAFPSNKENLTPQLARSLKTKEFLIPSHSRERIEKEIMKKRVERIPFQALLEISSSKTNCAIDRKNSSKGNSAPIEDDLSTRCEPNCPSRSSTSEVLPKAAEEDATIWNIVVDANCFLDEESRKALSLFEGLKGTHLIIPRIVIRELDCLKRRECFFSKSTKMASKALQWIEECMINKSWWIHVQSSFETLPVAPTPPISPRSPYADGINSKSFSTHGSMTEIVSPTAEDHILDCALLFKQTKIGAKFILLSNSVILKIKAMAEGLLCETPKEFRESLVNPFSKRFLWADSSPRGSTWSCSNYVLPHHQPARKVGKVAEDAKGLKLILLHNSQYGRIIK